MSTVRRALLLATGDRYVVTAINLATLAIVSRLLAPGEIGIYVLGMMVIALVLAFREFATSEFLIQRQTVTAEDVRTSFTIIIGFGLVIVAAVWLLAPRIGAFYAVPELASFLYVAVLALLLDAVSLPVIAQLQRDLAFGRVAVLNVASSGVAGLATCALAWLGFSYMSVAWANLASAAMTAAIAFSLRPDFGIFRPSLKSWRKALSFGGYHGATMVLGRATETIPLLVLGRVLPVAAVGLYNRALVVCALPDKMILSGIFSVALPALAGHVRSGHTLKEPYLRAIGHIAAVYWPAQAMIILLAHPIVELALGRQWLEIVPLVQLIAAGYVFTVPLVLTRSVLVSLGAFRDFLMSTAISSPVSIAVLCTAGLFGLEALAAGFLITLPFQMAVQHHFVCRHIHVSWADLARSVWRSAVVTAASAAGPLLVIGLSGFRVDLSIPVGIAGGIMGGLFWLAALYLTRHPLLDEICDLAGLKNATTARLCLTRCTLRLMPVRRH